MIPGLEIRTAAAREIPALERLLPSGLSHHYLNLFNQQQRGQASLLVAWWRGIPIGSGAVWWPGPRDTQIAAVFPGCPEIFALEVIEQRRSQGVGKRLVVVAEALAQARGHTCIGLGVALTNSRARILYERLGYRAWVGGTYLDRSQRLDPNGEPVWVVERCVFMVKTDAVAR
jgi:ribosomal protein S18 acetylase RimI-like enzyme